LINARTRDKVADVVSAAVANGASVRAGGGYGDLPGYHYQATVLADVKPDDAILRAEIFGPVGPVVTFSSVEEAIALANDSQFGLIAYLYTRDLDRGLSVSRRLQAGMVGLNRAIPYHWDRGSPAARPRRPPRMRSRALAYVGGPRRALRSAPVAAVVAVAPAAQTRRLQRGVSP
jgi:acyl-CoA reductase-like NAD-dependent aldehyde dehydrogenase